MEKDTMDNGKMIKKMVMESIIQLMVNLMKVFGQMINFKEKNYISNQKILMT